MANKLEYSILILNKDINSANEIETTLTNADFKDVDVVNSIEDLINTVDNKKYNLIILDEDGNCSVYKETLSAIVNDKRSDIQTSVIAILHSYDAENMQCLAESSIYYFIFKPFDMQELVARINILMDKDQHHHTNLYNDSLESIKSEAVGDMIAMIAHQWRQPLNTMATSVSNIELELIMDMLDTEDLAKTLIQMKTSIEYLSQTIDDFRYFFMPTKDKELVNTTEIFKRSQAIIDMKLAHNRIMMITNEPYVEEKVEVFTNELVQVIINIINNAMDEIISKSIPSPCIWISSSKDEEYIFIHIKDNAGGIPKDILPKIFDPYFSTKKKKNGSGLGLYMSKMIIEKHCNGDIYAKNVGNGVEFTIKLPYEKK
ncbi:MAG: response regulator [Helicobacteraceae bacterium]|nr:response regulator [Helicobacteraceae bacterium]